MDKDTTVDEIEVGLKEDNSSLYSAIHGGAEKKFEVYRVTKILSGDRFLALRGEVAVFCHGNGVRFLTNGQSSFVTYEEELPDQRPEVEVQDSVLILKDTVGATTIWSTPGNYEQTVEELDLNLD